MQPHPRATLATICLVALLPSTLVCQRVRGSVKERDGAPVAGAVASLVDSSGRPVARSLTDGQGRYDIVWPSGGSELRLVRIGYRPIRQRLTRPAVGDTVVDFIMDRIPFQLPAVVASSDAVCRGHADVRGARDLWEQTRSGLLATIVARESKPGQLATLTYDRVLTISDQRIVRQHMAVRGGIDNKPYYAARSPRELVAQGYRSGSGGDEVYYAPDADVLFDESFAESHCFGLKSDKNVRPGMIGIQFEPQDAGVSDRVDVRGVVWIDSALRQLTALEFQYTGSPRTTRATAGGTLHFQSVANGVSFIDQWLVHLPVFLNVPFRSRVPFGDSLLATQTAESGGIALHAQWADGTSWVGHNAGAIEGQIVEERTRDSVAGVIVDVAGVGTTVSDAHGRFEFGPLPPGHYELEVTDSTFGTIAAARHSARQVVVNADDRVVVNIAIKSRTSVLKDICPSGDTAVVVLGSIVGVSGDSLSRLRVQAEWQSAGAVIDGKAIINTGRESASVDPAGHFHFCGVTERPMQARILAGKTVIADTTLLRSGDRLRQVNWMVHWPRAPSPR